MPRIFIGIDLPARIKDALYEVSTALMVGLEDIGVRWVPRENMHFTLKFLGSVPEEKLDDIQSAIEKGTSNFRKFPLSLGEVDGFPSNNRARVIWVGIHHGAPEVISLSRSVEEALSPLGFEPEVREFKPHITLARLKKPAPIKDAIAELPQQSFAGRYINVDGITIFQSRLKRSGAEYEPLRYIPLRG